MVGRGMDVINWPIAPLRPMDFATLRLVIASDSSNLLPEVQYSSDDVQL